MQRIDRNHYKYSVLRFSLTALRAGKLVSPGGFPSSLGPPSHPHKRRMLLESTKVQLWLCGLRRLRLPELPRYLNLSLATTATAGAQALFCEHSKIRRSLNQTNLTNVQTTTSRKKFMNSSFNNQKPQELHKFKLQLRMPEGLHELKNHDKRRLEVSPGATGVAAVRAVVRGSRKLHLQLLSHRATPQLRAGS